MAKGRYKMCIATDIKRGNRWSSVAMVIVWLLQVDPAFTTLHGFSCYSRSFIATLKVWLLQVCSAIATRIIWLL